VSLAVSPDGKTLATGDLYFTVCLWEVGTGKQRSKLKRHYFPVDAVAFSPDGKTLASAVWNGSWFAPPEAKLWDVATEKEIAVFKGHKVGITGIAFSPDGGTLATASYDQTITLWDVPR
jgi:WD40 repeat protein